MHIEELKATSQGLQGSLEADLADGAAGFTYDNGALLKFHGIYQQMNRDERQGRLDAGLQPAYKFMVRCKFPGGRLTSDQYLLCDEIARDFADNDLRVTSRQNIQFHGVKKSDLRTAVRLLNVAGGITTLGAAGDVVRNVTAPPLADLDARYGRCGTEILALATRIDRFFAPQTGAYHRIWLGDNFASAALEDQAEPFYAESYLPRKFKIAIAADFDNSTDILANDLGLLAVTEQGRITGFEVFVGGGLGFSPVSGDSDSRLAQPLAFVEGSRGGALVEAVVKVFRDYGCRTNRHRARLKYLLQDWGIGRFREKVGEYAGWPLTPPQGVLPSGCFDHFGWHEQTEAGLRYVGIRLNNGRIRDLPSGPLYKTALREITRRFGLGIRLTPQHDIILTHISFGNAVAIQSILDECGVQDVPLGSFLRRHDMACPALPYCGMAITEAERLLPSILSALEAGGHSDAAVQIRMSGCSNGCSRPRTGEIGIIGSGRDLYDLYVGGSRLGLRLNFKVAEKAHPEQIVAVISHLIHEWKTIAKPGESFGDWSSGMGAERVSALCVSGLDRAGKTVEAAS